MSLIGFALMSFTHKFKVDTKALTKLKRDLRKLIKTEVEWGWINGKAYPKSDINGRGGIPYAIVAAHNEFGAYVKNLRDGKFHYIPPRPYFQQSIRAAKQISGKESVELFRALLSGQEYKSHLKAIADGNAATVKASIAKQNMKKLHPKTIGYKGHETQWKDTGGLINNITGKVVYKRSDYKG